MPLRLIGPARRLAALTCATAALGLGAAGTATAADSIYWLDTDRTRISHANLSGGGGNDFPRPTDAEGLVSDFAIDAASGRLFWIAAGRISYSDLDGGGAQALNTAGAPPLDPFLLAIDPVARRIYWANGSPRLIGYANLDGGGGGTLNTAGTSIPAFASDLVVHPAGGRIYWADRPQNRISFANLDGSGGGDLIAGGPAVEEPSGLAIDAGARRIYWANSGRDTIASASLGGGPGTELPTSGLSIPTGLAIDSAAGRLYTTGLSPTVGVVPFPGGGGATPLDISGASVPPFAAARPILLKAPSPSADPVPPPPPAPALATRPPGTRLSCSVRWAGDLVEANLMRAPQTVAYRWLRDGVPVPGATGPELPAVEVGQYACESTATNFAGSTSASGPTLTIASRMKLRKVRLNRNRGTATLSVAVEGPGAIVLRARGIRKIRRTATAAGRVKLEIRAKGKAKRRLAARGSARVRAKLTFIPAGGAAQRLSKSIVLKQRAKRAR